MVKKIRSDRRFRSYAFSKNVLISHISFDSTIFFQKFETLHRSEFNFLSLSPHRNSLNASSFPPKGISRPRAGNEISFLAGNLTRRATLASLENQKKKFSYTPIKQIPQDNQSKKKKKCLCKKNIFALILARRYSIWLYFSKLRPYNA